MHIYAIMKTMCPPGYHYNGFVVACAQVHQLPQSHCGDKSEGTLFSRLHIYYAPLLSVRLEQSWITYDQYIYIYIYIYIYMCVIYMYIIYVCTYIYIYIYIYICVIYMYIIYVCTYIYI